jgi:hypothetical protein
MPSSFPDAGPSVCEDFAVFAGAAITFGATNIVIGGDVGTNGGAITTAITHEDGKVANATESAIFNAIVSDSFIELTAIDADAQEFAATDLYFTPGTWHATAIVFALSTTIVLDGQDDPNSKFLFQSDTYLTTGVGVTISLINGAKAENIIWALKGYFVTGANTVFEGSVLAGSYVTTGADTHTHGCIVAKAAITMGAGTHVTVVPRVYTARPSDSPSAPPPTTTPSESPPSSPTGSPTADDMIGCLADSINEDE